VWKTVRLKLSERDLNEKDSINKFFLSWREWGKVLWGREREHRRCGKTEVPSGTPELSTKEEKRKIEHQL